MVKTLTRLHITQNMQGERLTFQGDPVDDCALHSLCVIGPGTIDAFLDLLKWSANRSLGDKSHSPAQL